MRRLLMTLILSLSLLSSFAQVDSTSGPVQRLDSTVIVSESARQRLLQAQLGLDAIDEGIVRKVPAFLGERDIIKVIQMLPGVQSPSEGSSGFSVRGGLIDQNLILLDGVPLYCAGHFLGFISMFNDDILSRTDLYKGDFPATFGGRISSVLDVSTKDGDMEKYHGRLS
ncbi:MAG: Plug domain-containing protein, partial [Bacteroidales bacterium]|nr:Plug domain-containing protein [Bacteroidales bacterium]